MADAKTPNYGWTMPTFGLDRDTWGDLLNANLSALDSQLKAESDFAAAVNSRLVSVINTINAFVEPIGSVKPWPVPTAPPNWLPCDGYWVSRSQYSQLFAVLGTYYGAGDGSTTFALPNWQGYTLVHRGWWMPYVAAVLGETAHTLAASEMPYHGHSASADGQGAHVHNYTSEKTNYYAYPNYPSGGPIFGDIGYGNAGWHPDSQGLQTDNQGYHSHNISIGGAGGGAAHNNIQPSIGVLWIIKCFNQAM